MSGSDMQYGVCYQNCVGTLRTLDFINDLDLMHIEFESKDEEIEDIRLTYYDGRMIFEQVKKRDTGSWTPSTIRDILVHFSQSWELLESRDDISFRFTTNAGANSDLQKIVRNLKELRDKKLELARKNAIIRKLKQIGPSLFQIDSIFEVALRVEFKWNFGAPEDYDNPVEKIKEECIETIEKQCGFLKEKAEIAFESLYQKVTEFSIKRGSDRIFTKRELSNILPSCVDIIEKLDKTMLPPQIKVTLLNEDLAYLELDKRIEDGSISFIAPIVMLINKRRFILWSVTKGTTRENINDISTIVEKKHEYEHIILIFDEDLEWHFGQAARDCIIPMKEPNKLLEKVGK